MTRTILGNATIICPERVVQGTLVMEGGQITEILPGADLPGALDCNGDFLVPGLIELHTDNLERHIEPRPEVDWPREAAIMAHDAELAGAGITTVFDALRVGSISPSKDGYYPRYARALADDILALKARGVLRISHLLHLRAEICSEILVEELDEFTPADGVGIVSLMDHTPGQRQFRDISKLHAYMRKKKSMTDADFARHVEILQSLRAENGERHERAVVDFATRLGATLASHDDTDAGQVAQSARYGIRLAEFPTTLEAARACHADGIRIIMGAPNLIRGGSHSGNISAAELAKEGLLDIVSSDYVPSALMSSALLLGDMWQDLPRAIRTVTATPAEAAGLADRGRLVPGLRADVVRVTRLGPVSARLRGTWVAGERVA